MDYGGSWSERRAEGDVNAFDILLMYVVSVVEGRYPSSGLVCIRPADEGSMYPIRIT